MGKRPDDLATRRPSARRPASTAAIALIVGLCVLIGVVLFAFGMAQMR